ncbi:twin-arginine translocase subunit TatB [Chelatococcus sambhunathii]|uniref:Sec-independent protein translocase protein TatB n=1 Tax=Chelatococcus sambhunathii TaxID=363953 RepID=A0ABU1DJX6_9HYPH|nr:Sec-independent protein translocase protein TatB [Chelatococcus sambhunathii]MDR4308426.1 twin-arginine translocase subunit TatB [Chelatococcus sambhunathii]
MFDIAWSEFLVIGVVALVVVGPRDLPALLRTVGKTVATLRRMAGEFQTQFNDAMREAELDDLKNEVAGLKNAANKMVGASPFQIARDELKNALESKPKAAPSALAGEAPAETEAAAPSALAPEIEPTPEPPAPTEAEFAPTPSEPAEIAARQAAARAASNGSQPVAEKNETPVSPAPAPTAEDASKPDAAKPTPGAAA